ncbi:MULTISPECIES: 3-hydroxyanthranilate 3,4-dioxygenase [Myroides]|uniref:3-hydroxyanthranilate 3,4-dioxygenase n=1 Tax=Myroides albus TaxID=2562892 RepID=A0A6I3LPN2_9FLAO|nr:MULTISPECIES: 3-hydroxyanthranilate 3,4-dioxygenase [Myroides]MTG97935.1 3-hydroxyanthranilate 3,4-dioxygenase [Myroides albus]MVX36400.1 3-hydroxyanthranilate 3,4-dioxygenase [Myroides sp. LoEW2-1]UVD81123.1 3-hydroxyanthranilate 3,4-dioxygenase [Myroides albus]
MSNQKSINIYKWIEDNKNLLQPPVGNKNIYPLSDDYIVMVVGGPNARKDFHYNEAEEFFFQLQGTIYIDIQENGERKRVTLEAGDIYLLPAKVPHSPIRTENSVGLVIEKKRAKGQNTKDGLLWYCEQCNHKLHEVYFELTNIETDFLPHFNDFYSSEELRTCKNCNHIMESDPKFTK